MHPLLRHVALRPRGDALAQRGALLGGQVGAEHRRLADRTLERLDDQLVEAAPRVVERGRLAQPPGRDRRQSQRLAEQLLAELGQVAQQGAGLEHTGTQRIRQQHGAATRAVGQARDTERRIGAQFQRIAVVVVLTAQHRVDALQAFDGLHPDTAVAHRQIAALDQREAQVAGQQRMLEIRLVVGARRQQHDQRTGALRCTIDHVLRRPAQQRLAQRIEERRQVLHMQFAEHLREDARDDQPVLQRVAGSRRRLGAIGDDPPVAVGRARQIGRVVEQVHAARRVDALHLMQVAAVAEDDRRRDRAGSQQVLRAVDVAQHAVQQVGALRDAGGDLFPFGGREQQRQGVDLPGTVSAFRVGVDVVGDPVLADLAFHQRQRLADLESLAGRQRAQERIPVRARQAGGRQQFVVTALDRGVSGKQPSQHVSAARPPEYAGAAPRGAANGTSEGTTSSGTTNFIRPIVVWAPRRFGGRRVATSM